MYIIPIIMSPEETATAILENVPAAGLLDGIRPLAEAYLAALELIREKDERLATRETVIAEHNQTIDSLRVALAQAGGAC